MIAYVTAGDPPLEHLRDILEALAEAGADAIEVGFPFSDPIADGPTIQASSQRALERGTTPKAVLDAVRGFEAAPLIAMAYTNTANAFGFDAFALELADAGFSGAILTDMIPEGAREWQAAAHAAGIDTIFLAAPTSTDERLDLICQAATGFVYAVSRTGVTGSESQAPAAVADLVGRIKRHTSLPVCVGFGISKPEHVRMVCQVADGAVVGSWLVKLLHENWPQGKAKIVKAVSELKAATQRA